MNTASLSTGLTLALGSALTFAAFIGGGGRGPASPTFDSSSNRELERRLDLVVNGSGGSTAKPRPASSLAPDDSADRLTRRTTTALLGLIALFGLLIVIWNGLAGLARRRRFARAAATTVTLRPIHRTS